MTAGIFIWNDDGFRYFWGNFKEMERFTLAQIVNRPGWWSVTDSRSGVRIDFEAGNFNDSQEVVVPDTVRPDARGLARLMNEFGEFMSGHRELV